MKRHFTSKEVKEIIGYESNGTIIETIQGEDRRWSRTNMTIVKIDDKFYKLEWEQGLTENQENEYPEQDAQEVFRVEKEIKQIIVTWEPIE